MYLKVSIVVSAFVVVFLMSQIAEGKDSSVIMKVGRMIMKRLGRYTKPLLMGTEEFTSKVTRDVGTASKFSVRNAINGMLFTNKMLEHMLMSAKSKIPKKAAAAAAPPAGDAPPADAPPA